MKHIMPKDNEWIPLVSKTGTEKITLPSSFNELLVYVNVDGVFNMQFTFAKVYLSPTYKAFRTGYYLAPSSSSSFVRLFVSTTSFYLDVAYVDSSDCASSTITTIYYR